MKTVGILGGGQLGLLLALSLSRLGARVIVYDPDVAAPARKVAWKSFQAPWTDVAALKEFAAACDVITYEFENVETSGLKKLSGRTPIYPSLEVLATTQDRIFEKEFLHKNNLPVAAFFAVQSYDELAKVQDGITFPCILKTATGGYDGKGQFVFENIGDLQAFLKDRPLPALRAVVEEKLPLFMELSCIVARNSEDAEQIFPVAQNTHQSQILDTTVMPADIPATLAATVKDIALRAAEKLNLVGLLTCEFFITREAGQGNSVEVDGYHVFVNEFAPRPHNSGHITMNATTVSQYDLLARILLDVPLVEPRLLTPGYFCLANLLGEVWLGQGTESGAALSLNALKYHADVVDVVLYGKESARAGRKMGHLVTYGASAAEAIEAARNARTELAAAAPVGAVQ
ncbi:MAG: ATP-grasp domain-containing protein [Cyanobacteria bacterium SZAS LIN-3]|nr:ATP-grasp domain-containing protein [Cyanobacteria bacterium SZAS LIN-3]